MRIAVVALVVLPLYAACPDRTVSKLPPLSAGEITKVIPTSTDIDVLFVIDDSKSTNDKQKVFASNFKNFVAALDAFPHGRPNVHVGVISTSVDIGATKNDWGAACGRQTPYDGRLLTAPQLTGCTPPNGHWIEDVAAPGGGRTTNYSGPLDQELSCIAELGTGGCGFEAPLQAVERAFDGTHPENDGFLRPGAYLAIIVLTDEDDCSARDHSIFDLDDATYGQDDFRCQPLYAYTCDQPIEPGVPGAYTNCRPRTDSYLEDPAHYHDVLTALKAPGQVVVAVIGGDPEPDITTGPITMPFAQDLALQKSCDATINGNYAIGRPGLRLNDFVTTFGDHGIFESVCQPDYSKALTDIGTLLFDSVSPCLAGDVDATDVDPDTPGLQLDCVVTDVVGLNTPQAAETVIGRCPMIDAKTPAAAPRPCWWVDDDATCAAPSSGLALHVERAQAAPSGDDVEVRCTVE